MKKILHKLFGGACADCAKVHSLLNVIIDDEATKDEETFFRDHIDECTPCLERYNVERSLIDKIKSKIDHKCCPLQVIQSIKEKIKGMPSKDNE